VKQQERLSSKLMMRFTGTSNSFTTTNGFIVHLDTCLLYDTHNFFTRRHYKANDFFIRGNTASEVALHAWGGGHDRLSGRFDPPAYEIIKF
jgi:hypothetical protein